MTFEANQLNDALFLRKTQMQVMRAGYGIAPDKMYVLFSATSDCDLQTLEKVAYDIAQRYFEIDVVLASNTTIALKNEALAEEDNCYVLENLNDEQLVLLHHKATAVLTTCEDLTEICHEIGANLMLGAQEILFQKLCDLFQKKGLNRQGTTTTTNLDTGDTY